MINWGRVEELKEEVGAEAFGEVIELFLEEVDEATSRIADTKDRSTLPDDLHFLKGAAMNLGFAEFAAICAEYERTAKTDGNDAPDIGLLVTCYAESKSVFMDQISSLNAA